MAIWGTMSTMLSASSTQVVILSPAALYRDAWRALLSQQPGLHVTGAVGDVAGLLPLPPSGALAVLLDVAPPAVRAAALVRQALPSAGVLVLVGTYELADVLALLQAGATGCISRDASVGQLARSLIAVGRGEIVLPPALAGQALAALARGTADTLPVEPLTEREDEIVRLLARGLTNKDIAQALVLSVRTVEAHLRSIYGKLDVHSRTEAALWAVRHGYPSDGPHR